MGLNNEESIKLPDDLQKKIERIRAQTAISERETLDLKNGILILNDTISSLNGQEKELKERIGKLVQESEKKGQELERLSNQCTEKMEILEKTRKEYLDLSVKIDDKKIKQDKTNKENSLKEKELKDKESELLQREIDISNAETEHAIKVNKLADFISKL